MKLSGPFFTRIHIISTAFFGSKKIAKKQKYYVMYYTLCRSYRGPDGTSKEKEAYTPSKPVMLEYEGS